MRLIVVVVGWCVGIVLARHGAITDVITWGVLAALMLPLTIVNWRNPPFRWWNVAILFLALGGLRYAFAPQTAPLAAFNGNSLTLQGRVIAAPDVRDTRTLLRVDVAQVMQGGKVHLTDGIALVEAPRALTVTYGDTIEATGDLITPGEYDTFSYADYLAQQNIFSILDQARVRVVTPGDGHPLQATIIQLRHTAQDAINAAMPEPQAGLLVGILTGNERGISPPLDEDFQQVGASHIIAISGFNMVILAAVVIGLLRIVFNQRRWPPVIAALVVIGLYTLFAGANAAVVRAALMSAMLFIAQALQRKTFVPTSLAFVALLMSLHNPRVLWDVGFQLSFAAVMGLAFFATPIGNGLNALLERILPQSGRQLGALLQEPLVVTFAAQITVLPLTLLYFGNLTPYALLVNVLIIPAQAYILILGALGVLTFWLAPLSGVFFSMTFVLLSWTIAIIRGFASLPGADATVFVHPRWVLLFYLVLGVWMMVNTVRPRWLRNRWVISTAGLTGVAVLALIVALINARPDGRLNVWFLDVGHSNAALIQTPNGAHILIDGGRYPSRLLTHLGDRLPFNDRTLEMLIITQPDPWDVNALPAVLDRYTVAVALVNGQPNLSADIDALNAALSDTTVQTVGAGYSITTDDGVTLEILHPQTPPTLDDNRNRVPLVVRVHYGDVSILLPGDLSVEGQRDMLDVGHWPLATVLQLPDHATERSLDRDFIAAVQPRVIVMQIDRANRRGDPDTGTLALLLDDALILRTDTRGTVHLWTDGTNLWTAD
jgi:competence protein ComEC